jgi:transcriptional regulator with XRE-family HTH domain
MAKDRDLPGIGDRLRQAREAAGLSQGQAAKLLGMHRPSITEIENESRKVSAGELKQFAELYHVSMEWLANADFKANNKIKLAARKLTGLKEEDLDTIMRIIDSFRKSGANQ